MTIRAWPRRCRSIWKRWKRGDCPSRKEFLDGHPEIAAELGGCLDGLEFVHEAARAVHQVEPAEESPVGHVSTAAPRDELTQPLGDYRIVREIGRGGMGVVYEAMQLSLGRRVALKILPLAAALDPKHLQRFKNEAQAAVQLHHTNIVPVYAVGSERGVHYYAMQLIDGYSLADLIEQRRQFFGKSVSVPADPAAIPPTEKAIAFKPPIPEPPKLDDPTLGFVAAPPPVASAETLIRHSTVRLDSERKTGSEQKTASERNAATYFRTAAGLIQQAAQALEHAHQLGVVHRDIKPANLLLDERGNGVGDRFWPGPFSGEHAADADWRHAGNTPLYEPGAGQRRSRGARSSDRHLFARRHAV